MDNMVSLLTPEITIKVEPSDCAFEYKETFCPSSLSQEAEHDAASLQFGKVKKYPMVIRVKPSTQLVQSRDETKGIHEDTQMYNGKLPCHPGADRHGVPYLFLGKHHSPCRMDPDVSSTTQNHIKRANKLYAMDLRVDKSEKRKEFCGEASGDCMRGKSPGSMCKAKEPYLCVICQRVFTQNIHLVTHVRTHTGEKPYQCKICQKQFTQSSTLMTHRRTHTGEKPFECLICQKHFTSSSTFNEHKRVHTGEKPFRCMVCHKRFSQSSALTRHNRTHTKEKPYECMVCHKQFSESSALSKHNRTHTKEKPYQCKVCFRQFSSSTYVHKHEKSHMDGV